MPELSIITPVFNGILFIEACILNVIEQQCPEAEHLIIDGGSTDGTVEVIRKYAAEYPHLRWISEKDRGQSDAMNKGIALANGKIIGFLNVDDYYEVGVLGEILERFKQLPEPTLLVGNCNIWDDEEKLPGLNKPACLKLEQLLVANESIYPFPLNPSAYFYHRSLHNLIGLYDVDEHYVMDIEFILRAVSKCHVIYLDKILGNFRFIEGAKTFDDMKAGTGEARFRKLIQKYRERLTFRQKVYLCRASLVAVVITLLRMTERFVCSVQARASGIRRSLKLRTHR